MAKKTLAEQIAELSKPDNPDYDIEDSERGVFEHEDRSGSDDESNNFDDELRNEHYIKVGKSKLRDNSIKIKGSKYVGKQSTRKEIFDESEDDINSDDLEDSESEDDSKMFEEAREEQDEEDSEESNDEDENMDDDSDAISLRADSEDEENSDDSDSESASEAEEEITTKRESIKKMIATERKQVINRLSTTTQTDALKGYAVIKQQTFFDNIIDARIKLQKAVTSSNLLPLTNEIFEEFQQDGTEEALATVEKSLHNLLDNIISLRTIIYNKEKITKEPLKFKKNNKRSFEDYLKDSEELDTALNNYRGPVLTKWSHKVQSASGATALNASKFKTVNQSAAQQVEVNLLDMDRLLKRTRMNRRSVKPLGYIEEEEEKEEDSETKQIDRSLKEDKYVFDDEDFYRVLLNDLVDKKISDSNPTNGLTIQLTKTKLKKNIDTKASKGRKLKYSVQEPILNYEAPKGRFRWSDEQIDEFFAGLLGQRVNFNEDEGDEQEEAEEENNEEELLLKNDDLKIFG